MTWPPSIVPTIWLSISISAWLISSPTFGITPVNQLTEAEARSGWKLLFDGESVQGWRNYRQRTISAGWEVVSGDLVRSGDQAGDIVSESQYANFELSLEYRISPGGNSGIMFRVVEADAPPWHSGPEIQIQDNRGGRDPQQAGWLYQLYKPELPPRARQQTQNAKVAADGTLDATRPAGEWNHLYIRITDTVSEVVMNGLRYYRFEIGSTDWKERVAKSKFAEIPGFAAVTSGHICLQDHGNLVAFRNIKIRDLGADGAGLKQPIDAQMPMRGELAFPQLTWENWEPIDEQGKTQPQRLIELTHAHDDSGRLFVAAQSGVIYVFPNDPQATQAKVFLDLSGKVADWQRANEEGQLGLAFSPRYRQHGEFYVYYTLDAEPRRSIIARYRVSPTDPDRADASSEQVVLEIPQPFGNHNGGSMEFGPDGYLYIGLGDGGDRNDPFGNGQNLATLLGKVLRIDVEQRTDSHQYAIPADNPFISTAGACPEIYAYGLRNPWRLAFDRGTGRLWAGDVGQELWEEVDIIQRGGNYGWSLREGTHPFGNLTATNRTELIEPVWEYDHQIGMSITGGRVYRGSRHPELAGKYLYADYVSGRVWALEYDSSAQKVTKNIELIAGGVMPLAFGEDAAGEVYYMTAEANGKCIFRLEPTSAAGK